MPELKDVLKPLIKRRAGFKGIISVNLKELKASPIDELKEFFDSKKDGIIEKLDKIKEIDTEIVEAYFAFDVSEEDASFDNEIKSQSNYRAQVTSDLKNIQAKFAPVNSPKATSVKLPKLTCQKFDGRSTNPLAFKNFMVQFRNCVGVHDNLSDTSKLTFLRGFYTGHALNLITHLSVCDDNYQIAIDY